MEREKSERIAYIDLIKCIAMFMVLLYHSPLYSWDFLQEQRKSYYILYYFRTILSAGVPLFFVVNGYLLFNKEFELRRHIIKTMRLIIQTIIWGIISLLLLQIIKNQYLSARELFEVLWQWKINWLNHLWYMGALVCIYLFFPLLKQVYDTNIKIFVYFVVISSVLTFGNIFLNEIITLVLNGGLKKSVVLQSENLFNIFNPLRGIHGYSFVYFCVGGLMNSVKNKIDTVSLSVRNTAAILGILLSCLGLWGLGIYYSDLYGKLWDVVWNGYDTVFTFFNVIFIFIICLNWKRDRWFTRIFSCNTLGIYFLHMLIIHATMPFVIEIQSFCNIWGNIVYASIIMGVCLMVSLILKKIPVFSNLVK